MDFSAAYNEASAGLFLAEVGDLIAERREEIPQLWKSACSNTWTEALRNFRPTHNITCPHEDEDLDCNDDSCSNTLETEASNHNGHERKRNSELAGSGSRSILSTRSVHWDSRNGSILREKKSLASRIGNLDIYSSSQSSSSTSSRPTPTYKPRPQGSKAQRKICSQCEPDDPTIFPFCSDAMPLAILMFCEAIQNHKELSFHPMKPAYIPHRPEYLSNGMSFRVTHVPWEQVRVDTGGRLLTDAVYKRLNRKVSKKAWLQFMKDLTVTHHMTYHVSESHRKNIVQLLALGWESVVDEFVGEPTLAPVIALEYASHGTLEDAFLSSPVLSTYSAKVLVILDIAGGLQALHLSGIIHGDVKPSNILICKDAEHGIIAKLSDFGLSIIDPDAGPELQALPGHTPGYSAPEISRPLHRDHLKFTDNYSFGLVVWQTLLGGTNPFFSMRYQNGAFLSIKEIQALQVGKHGDLAHAYGVSIDYQMFKRLNECEELSLPVYEPHDDQVNDLLLAIAADNVGALCDSSDALKTANIIPRSELSLLLSILQILLSSCPVNRQLGNVLLLLGKPYDQKKISISKIVWKQKVETALQTDLHYQTTTPRTKDLYSSVFERFFATLQRNPATHDLKTIGYWDGVLAKHLSSSLLEHYMWEYLEGTRSEALGLSICNALALASSAGDISLSAAGLGIHQLLEVSMNWSNLYTAGIALAMLQGDINLWNIEHPACETFQAQLIKGLNQRMQYEQADQEQMRIIAHVLMDAEVGPLDIDYQNSEGYTALHLAAHSGNSPLILELVAHHGASASIPNIHGEEPMHWLHCIPSTAPDIVEAVTVLLAKAGGDPNACADSRTANYATDNSNIHMYPTPLMRAIARRNHSAVACLVQLEAHISMEDNEIYARYEISPLTLASSMLEYKSLEIMLRNWETKNDPQDPDSLEARKMWEDAIGGQEAKLRIKMHGNKYAERVRSTCAVLTKYLGPGWLVRRRKASLYYAVEGGDLVWVEALLESLYSDPRTAVLADLQMSLECAVNAGYKNIAAKLMQYGALALLPHDWSNNNPFTLGRPGKWNEELVDRLVQEMYSKGHIAAETWCPMHCCSSAGRNAVATLQDILRQPVVNDCLQPSLPDANDYGLPHFVTAIIEGQHPRLDRSDRENFTLLYGAMVNVEFTLAQLLIDQGAKHDVNEWSLLAQLMEDGRPTLPQQIEFLLSRKVPPSFKLTRRAFGRIEPVIDFGLHPKAEMKNWRLEHHTIITATAIACQAFDETSKARCWRAVLAAFNKPEHVLQKAGDSRNALEITIDAADLVSLRLLVEALKGQPNVFERHTVLARIQNLLSRPPPLRVSDGVRKRKIVDYRIDLGDMVQLVLSAGDHGSLDTSPGADPQNLLEHIKNEFSILVLGLTQQAGASDALESFRVDVEKFVNAFMRALDTYHGSAELFNTNLNVLKKGLTELLAPYFGVFFEQHDGAGLKCASIELKAERQPISSSAAHTGITQDGCPHQDLTVRADHPASPKPLAVPFLNPLLYRKLVVSELRAATQSKLPIPKFSNTVEHYIALLELGFVEQTRTGTRVAVPGVGYFISKAVRHFLPRRATTYLSRQDSPRPSYYRVRRLMNGTLPAELNMETETNKRLYFNNVIRHFNPNAVDVAYEEMTRNITRQIVAHAESLVDTRALTQIDPIDIHPLFGKMHIVKDRKLQLMNLPMDAYTRGMGDLMETWGIAELREGNEDGSDEGD